MSSGSLASASHRPVHGLSAPAHGLSAPADSVGANAQMDLPGRTAGRTAGRTCHSPRRRGRSRRPRPGIGGRFLRGVLRGGTNGGQTCPVDGVGETRPASGTLIRPIRSSPAIIRSLPLSAGGRSRRFVSRGRTPCGGAARQAARRGRRRGAAGGAALRSRARGAGSPRRSRPPARPRGHPAPRPRARAGPAPRRCRAPPRPTSRAAARRTGS